MQKIQKNAPRIRGDFLCPLKIYFSRCFYGRAKGRARAGRKRIAGGSAGAAGGGSGYAACGGCEVTILDLGEKLLDILPELDFVYISSEYKIIVYAILYSTAIIYICFVTIKPRK